MAGSWLGPKELHLCNDEVTDLVYIDFRKAFDQCD